MRNIRLLLEYDGTHYHGWQTQARSGKATIQETLHRALAGLTRESIILFASGRTDSGVHAIGQVANFHTNSTIPANAWAPALNHLLPPDIRVLASDEAPLEFHARHSASGKIYRYRILNRRAQTALDRNYCWHVALPLSVQRMRKAASALLGRHDFSAFRSAGCSAASPVRTVRSLSIKKRGELLEIWIEADALLQYMARNITGTLVDVGLGKLSPADVKRILASKDRAQAGRTAPARGLYLVSVEYDSKRRKKERGR
jgi:tRNA pseudouridine38-40 synthase